MEYRNIKIEYVKEDEAIIITQLNGQIVTCNAQALELFGYNSIQDINKHNMRDLMPDDFSLLFPEILNPEHLNDTRYELHVVKHKNGELFPCLIRTLYQTIEGEKLVVGHLQKVKEKVDIEKLCLEQNILVLKRELMVQCRKNREKSYKETYQQLFELFPTLNNNDIKVCHYIMLNFDSTKIAEQLNITKDGVFAARKRIRKKLQLKPNEDLCKKLLSSIDCTQETYVRKKL
ncbi:MAG: PAS domain S-box protein [Carboxylicivirga sp.]|jgi:PAS domain S-box-containing protein|nr:PAS domain S-box protein [Carboxylicivirga sp.]